MEIKKVKGIGSKSAKLLEKLSIYSVYDLVTHYPFRYNILAQTGLNENENIIVEGIIESVPSIFRFKGKMNRMSFRINTNGKLVNVSIFNRAFLKNNLKIGKTITIIGKYDSIKNNITASDIKLEPIGEDIKIEPIYSTTSGLSNKILNNYVQNALEIYKENIEEIIPKEINEKYNFVNRKRAIEMIHNPNDIKEIKQAQLTLKYEELFLFMLKMNHLKLENKDNRKGLKREIDISKIEGFIDRLPFLLTYDQKNAVEEIIKDLKEPIRMNRLLQGDVGSGKTIVAVIALYYNFLGGYQGALMAPTEILANQHYKNIKDLFEDIDINIELLTGSLTRREKKRIYEDIKTGKINIIIGTHALIQDAVEFNSLGFVITDEQHRFGVSQRNNLQNKGIRPDILYMSATPIPRTYALTIYGDMDISNIKTLPSGRKKVTTHVKTIKEIKEVLNLMWEQLQKGHQIYVIAPLIEESEKMDLTNIYLLKDKMELAFGKKYEIDILHGKLEYKDKEKVMDKFSKGETNILISTTVVEVGVDVANATMIIIFDADHFGLSTLHQLRGRVGRSEYESYAILIGEQEKERLKIMEETHDGFLISEEDFNLRGHGDLFGIRQSGDMNFKIASIKKDFKILIQAKEDSYETLNKEDFHVNKEYENLRKLLKGIDTLN